MKSDEEIFIFLGDQLKFAARAFLLVVSESSGSSPGRHGFKMAITPDELAGSIGGGVMEVDLVNHAKERLLHNRNAPRVEILEKVHRKNAENSSGMICSGRQTNIAVWLDESDLHAIDKINSFLRTGDSVDFSITESGICVGAIDGAIYSAKIGTRDKLFIIGGGHCALALSEIAAKLGFHITVFDDRPNLNTIEKNHAANEINLIDSYDNIGNFVDADERAYVVVMTLGYKFDAIVLRQLINKDFKYFGVLGSKAKMRTLLSELEDEGFSRERLAKLHTPVGLPINSRTPYEIAVSIAAEIVRAKNV